MKRLAAITSFFAAAIALSGCASTVGGHNPGLSVETKKDESVVAQADHNPGPDLTAAQRSYTQPVYRWSVTYPADWRLDSANPDFVRLLSPEGRGLCGIHSGAVRFKTVDDFTGFMEASYADSFKARGVTVRSSPRQKIFLPNKVVGNDVVTDILSGGRSRRVYVVGGGMGYVTDCETYMKDWRAVEPSFARILSSFTLDRRP